ncbi:MBL fold metallo-hydrolase [Bacteroidota bacterium]
MKIICAEAGPILTNCYVIIDYNKNNALIVDCAFDGADSLFEILDKHKVKLDATILTHSHWDHSGDAMELHRKTGAPVLVHKDDEYRLLEPNKNTIMQLPFEIEAIKPHKYLEHGEIFSFNDIDFEVRHTPGHTEGSICLVNHKEKVVFAGDTIFNQSIGRTDLPGGSTELILNSIREQLMTLNDSYKVYCGHGPSTTIGEERRNNPFLTGIFF